MKLFLAGMVLSTSLAAVANDACSIRLNISKVSPLISEVKLLNKAEETLERRGFYLSYSPKNANYSISLTNTFIMSTRHEHGYMTGKVILSKSKSDFIAERIFKDIGNASYINEGNKVERTLEQIEKAILALPNCPEIL